MHPSRRGDTPRQVQAAESTTGGHEGAPAWCSAAARMQQGGALASKGALHGAPRPCTAACCASAGRRAGGCASVRVGASSGSARLCMCARPTVTGSVSLQGLGVGDARPFDVRVASRPARRIGRPPGPGEDRGSVRARPRAAGVAGAEQRGGHGRITGASQAQGGRRLARSPAGSRQCWHDQHRVHATGARQ
jgi:hypothetical protein